MLIQVGENFIDCIEARTNAEQTQGLLGMSGLKPHHGMLFFYEEEEERVFWMPPEMRFPIDLVFIGESGKIIEVYPFCQPGEGDPGTGMLTRFVAPAKWVLEIGAGEAERLGALPGVTVHFDDEEEEGGLV